MHGPAGFGKTTIAQSIANRAYADNILAASFFWSKPSGSCQLMKNERFVLTIASQLTELRPNSTLTQHIVKAVEGNPNIYNLNLTEQMQKLVIEPLLLTFENKSSASDFPPYLLLVTDGLHDCDGGDGQKAVLKLLLTAARQESLPLRILVCTRYESDVRSLLESKSASDIIIPYSLKRDRVGVGRFIKSEFNKIKASHPSKDDLSKNWPSPDDIRTLLKKAAGTYIYASAVITYIRSRDNNPQTRLKDVIKSSFPDQGTAFAPLDALYAHILHQVPQHHKNKLKEILFWLIILDSHRLKKIPSEGVQRVKMQDELTKKTVAFADTFLGFEPGDTRMILSGLVSVLHIPERSDRGSCLHFFHESFSDFLKHRGRLGDDLAADFLYTEKAAHIMMARKWIAHYQSYSVSDRYEPKYAGELTIKLQLRLENST